MSLLLWTKDLPPLSSSSVCALQDFLCPHHHWNYPSADETVIPEEGGCILFWSLSVDDSTLGDPTGSPRSWWRLALNDIAVSLPKPIKVCIQEGATLDIQVINKYRMGSDTSSLGQMCLTSAETSPLIFPHFRYWFYVKLSAPAPCLLLCSHCIATGIS